MRLPGAPLARALLHCKPFRAAARNRTGDRHGRIDRGRGAGGRGPPCRDHARRTGGRQEVSGVSPEGQYIFNTLSFLMHGFLVMWMAAGFAMLEAGLVRKRSVGTQLLKNVALYALAGIMFYLVGYNLMYAGASMAAGPAASPSGRLQKARTTPRWSRTAARMRARRTGSSRWCSSRPRPRSSPTRSPSASGSGRSSRSPPC